jgi:hypothetical protein
VNRAGYPAGLLKWATSTPGRYRLLPPISAELGAVISRTRHEGAVIVLPADPAAVDPVRFARLHHEYRRSAGT